MGEADSEPLTTHILNSIRYLGGHFDGMLLQQ